ncbi:MAG: hypothetical protein ABR575_01165, partial [Actinomycetota bacterium]
MIRLLRAELRRYWSRRAVRLVGVLLLIGIVVSAGLVFWNSSRDDSAGMRAYDEQVRYCVEFHESPEGRQGDPVPPGFDDAEDFCRSQIPVQAFDQRFHLTSVQDVLMSISIPLIILG